MTIPSTTRMRHGMAPRADFAGSAFRLPADLNLAILACRRLQDNHQLFQCRSDLSKLLAVRALRCTRKQRGPFNAKARVLSLLP